MKYYEIFYDQIGRRYVVAGAICTIAGYLSLYIAKNAFHFSEIVNNAVPFCVGLSLSFLLNAKYVFAIRNSNTAVPRFAVAFLFSYCANLIALFSLHPLFSPSSLVPQFVGFTVYSVSFYLINRFWSFRET